MLTMYGWGVVCVGIDHDVTLDTLGRLRQRLQAFMRRSEDLVLDLGRAEIDCPGLGALLALQRRLELQQRTLLVISESPQFQALLDATGTRSALRLYANWDEALAEIGCTQQKRALA